MQRIFSAIKLILTLHCDESERLISHSMDGRLPWAERWAVRLHYASCWSCRRFRRHLIVLREAARQRGLIGPEQAEAITPLGEAAKGRIAEAIDRCCHDSPPDGGSHGTDA